MYTKPTINLQGIFIIFTFLVSSGCGNSEKEENDLERLNFKGKVKKISEFKFESVDRFGNITKGERIGSSLENYTKIFNEKGNKIEVNKYNSDGSLTYKITWKYDEKGNKIEENRYNSDGSSDNKYTYKYDDKGNKIEENNYNSD